MSAQRQNRSTLLRKGLALSVHRKRRVAGSVNGRVYRSRQDSRRAPGVVSCIKRYILGHGCEDSEMSCKKFISLQEHVGGVCKIIQEDRAKNLRTRLTYNSPQRLTSIDMTNGDRFWIICLHGTPAIDQ